MDDAPKPTPSPPAAASAWGWHLPELRARHVLKVVVSLLAAFALWYLLRFPYSLLIVDESARILHVLGGPEPGRMFSVHERTISINTGLEEPKGKLLFQRIDVNTIHWNLVFFLALTLAMPFSMLRRRWLLVAAAAVVLHATHVLFFVSGTYVNIAELYASHGQPFLKLRALKIVGIATRTYGITLNSFVPFFLYLPVFLWRRQSGPRAPRIPGAAAGRNEPCPCGSGKKFKRCCGRR